MKYFLMALMLVSLGYGQSSYRALTSELLRDLQGAIADSTHISRDSLSLQFDDDTHLGSYLNTCIPVTLTSTVNATGNQVTISTVQALLSINRMAEKSVRNSRYLRQLELEVGYAHLKTKYTWKGKISDQLTKTQLKLLLKDEFPVTVTGDYSKDEPTGVMILLTTLSVFSLGAALFFIRT